MKRKPIISALAALLLLASACIEIEVKNTIHADGSIDRQVTLRDIDSEEFTLSELSIPVDSSWNLEEFWEVEDLGVDEETGKQKWDSVHCLRAIKHYSSAEELTDAYNDTGHLFSLLNRRATFRKTFKWFYTTYIFEETIPATVHQFPRSDYLTDREYRVLRFKNGMAEEDSPDRPEGFEQLDSLEWKSLVAKVDSLHELWMYDSFFYEYYNMLKRFAERQGRGWITPEMVQAQKDSLYRDMQEYDDPMETFSKHFGMDLEAGLGKEFRDSLKALTTKIETSLEMRNYAMSFEMPGEITHSNAESVIDSTQLRWDVYPEKFFSGGMHMFAESRTKNPWTFWVSGLFVLFVLGGFIYRAVRKKNN